MDVDEAARLLRVMQAGWPNQTATDDMNDLWLAILADLPAELGRDIVHRAMRDYKFWPTVHEWERLILEIRSEMWVAPVAPMLRSPLCDGTRWVDGPNGMTPCSRCNPYLYDLSCDPEKWAARMAGTPTYELHPNLDLVKTPAGAHVVDVSGRSMPAPCREPIYEDPQDPMVSPHVGYLATRQGYIAECAAQGKEPDWPFFDQIASPLLRRAPGA